jgi:hypothetical protein
MSTEALFDLNDLFGTQKFTTQTAAPELSLEQVLLDIHAEVQDLKDAELAVSRGSRYEPVTPLGRMALTYGKCRLRPNVDIIEFSTCSSAELRFLQSLSGLSASPGVQQPSPQRIVVNEQSRVIGYQKNRNTDSVLITTASDPEKGYLQGGIAVIEIDDPDLARATLTAADEPNTVEVVTVPDDTPIRYLRPSIFAISKVYRDSIGFTPETDGFERASFYPFVPDLTNTDIGDIRTTLNAYVAERTGAEQN